MSCINSMARDRGDSSACFPVRLKFGSVFGYLIWHDLMGKVQKLKKQRCEIQSFQTIDLFFLSSCSPFPKSP